MLTDVVLVHVLLSVYTFSLFTCLLTFLHIYTEHLSFSMCDNCMFCIKDFTCKFLICADRQPFELPSVRRVAVCRDPPVQTSPLLLPCPFSCISACLYHFQEQRFLLVAWIIYSCLFPNSALYHRETREENGKKSRVHTLFSFHVTAED